MSQGAASRTYRRRIQLGCDGRRAWADVEDDPHRFSTTIDYAAGRVTGILGEGLRTPWTTCALAADVLQGLKGAPLDRSPFEVLARVNGSSHCTHMLDLAALAISAAARNLSARAYEVSAIAWTEDGRELREGELHRDGARLAEWRAADWIMEAPPHCKGFSLRKFGSWLAVNQGREDDVEALFVLRRAVLVSSVVTMDLDRFANAEELPLMAGSCFTFQSGRSPEGRRQVGSTRDFTRSPTDLLSDPLARSRPKQG